MDWHAAHKLDVYRAALRFARFAHAIHDARKTAPGDVVNQLHRASSSVLLNIAEGAAELRKDEKRRFYRMAYRSANECFAALELLSMNKTLRLQEMRHELRLVFGMLSRLCRSDLN